MRTNYIIVEVENAEWAPCGGVFYLKINGREPPGFPVSIGKEFGAETAALNVKLMQQLRNISARNLDAFNWYWTSNAICSRRIYELDLR